MKLSLKNRTFLVFGIVILLSAIMAGTGYFTISSSSNYSEYLGDFSKLQEHLLQARRDEKDFISRESKDEKVLSEEKESKYHTKCSKQIEASKDLLLELREGGLAEDFNHVDSINLIIEKLDKYQELMDSLFSNFKKKGFKLVGLEGELRSAIHGVEDFDPYYDKADMLMLRRREKDFFLRLDKKYLGKFDKDMGTFVTHLNELKTSQENDSLNQVVSEKVDVILPLLETYKSAFHKNVAINELIGLKHNTGIKGEIRNEVHDIEATFKKLYAGVALLTEDKKSQLLLIFWA